MTTQIILWIIWIVLSSGERRRNLPARLFGTLPIAPLVTSPNVFPRVRYICRTIDAG